jgi:hypothetical protein
MAALKTIEVYLSNRVVVATYKDSSKSTVPKQVRGMASLWSEKSDADLATLLKKVDGVVHVSFRPRDI